MTLEQSAAHAPQMGLSPLTQARTEVVERVWEGLKPGWMQISLSYLLSTDTVDLVLDAVAFVAQHGWRLMRDYRFDPRTAQWRHRARSDAHVLRLSDLSYDDTGRPTYPRPHHRRAGEASEQPQGHREGRSEGRRDRDRRRRPEGEDVVSEAIAHAAEADPPALTTASGLPAWLESQRWFALDPVCLDPDRRPG